MPWQRQSVGVPVARCARHSDDFFAALVEQRLPQMRSRLINALQLGRQPQPDLARVVDTIVLEGHQALEQADLRSVTRSPLLRRIGIGLGAVLAVWLLYGVTGGPAVRASVVRVLLPWSATPPYTFTQLELQPAAPQRLLAGTPLNIECTARDRTGAAPPERAVIQWTDNAGRAGRADMRPAGPGKFAHTFDAVDNSFSLTVSAGDATSQPLTVQVDPRPRIEQLSAVLHHPEYTGLPAESIADFDGYIQALPGTRVEITAKTNKDLRSLQLAIAPSTSSATGELLAGRQGGDARTWTVTLDVRESGSYHFKLLDSQDYAVDSQSQYAISLLADEPPTIALTRPGRDLQLPPDATLTFEIMAQDRYGLGPVRLLASRSESEQPKTIGEWPGEGQPQRQLNATLTKSVSELGLRAGDHLQYWAAAEDRNPGTSEHPGPGKSQTRVYHLIILSPQQAEQLLNQQIGDYSQAIAELIKLQRQNRGETATLLPAAGLVERQGIIIRQSQRVADVMQKTAFPAQTIIDELRDLAAGPMATVLSQLEGYRDATELGAGRRLTEQSLPIQDDIIRRLEAIQMRLDRNAEAQRTLKKLEQEDPQAAKAVTAKLTQLSKDLDKFLADLKDLEDKYDRMPKRGEKKRRPRTSRPWPMPNIAWTVGSNGPRATSTNWPSCRATWARTRA